MKTLQHHVLVFDEDCPLCRAYTGAFIKTGMLDSSGREAYQQMRESTCLLVDKNRARNEIALVNTKTGQVIYGIDSLMRVLSNAWPVFAPLFRLTVFRWLMKKLYAFISYNRKVIIPARKKAKTCEPDLHLYYRWAYIISTCLFTAFILNAYSARLGGLIPPGTYFREFFICGGQIIFQGVALSFIAKSKRLDYLGNMMSISLAGALLLGLVMVIERLTAHANPYFYAGLFLLVAGLMFLEHWRRMRLLGVHWPASASWLLYRLLVLLFIL